MKVDIINGPNLNLLGIREPEKYGKTNFESYFRMLSSNYRDLELTMFQSNFEGELVSRIQQSGFEYNGIILNAGGYTHTSVAIADAIAAVRAPVIEVHITNIYAREEFRRHSLLSGSSKGIITGLGLDVYELALLYLSGKLTATR